MPTFYTKRNCVVVAKALEGDRYLAIYITPQNGGTHLLCIQPVEQSEEVARWALEMADVMEGPITIVPIASKDGFLRKMVEAIGFEGLWRKDPEEQRMGRELLIQLGVIKE